MGEVCSPAFSPTAVRWGESRLFMRCVLMSSTFMGRSWRSGSALAEVP